jgi:hypothetical protein
MAAICGPFMPLVPDENGGLDPSFRDTRRVIGGLAVNDAIKFRRKTAIQI